jgi:hypothetical protein
MIAVKITNAETDNGGRVLFVHVGDTRKDGPDLVSGLLPGESGTFYVDGEHHVVALSEKDQREE